MLGGLRDAFCSPSLVREACPSGAQRDTVCQIFWLFMITEELAGMVRYFFHKGRLCLPDPSYGMPSAFFFLTAFPV